MQERINPLAVFLAAFSISSFAGLAALLRAGEQVTRRSVFSAMLNSGLLGLIIAMMWHANYQDNIYFLIGVCILAGLGGNTMIDFMLSWLKSKITNTEIRNGDDKEHLSDKA